MTDRPTFSITKLNSADKILLGSSAILVIDSFLPWQHLCPSTIGADAIQGCSANAWGGSASLMGTLMGIGAILLMLWSVGSVTGLAATFGNLTGVVGAALVGATFGFGLLKFLVSALHHGSLFAWAGLILLLVIGYGGYMRLQEPTPPPTSPPREGGYGF